MKRNNKYNPVKKNLSSIQVLKTLKTMLEDDYTMSELLQRLNENEKEPVFNNSVVSKDINTCRFCGSKIPKINGRYYVTEIPFGLDFTDKDIDLLAYLENCAKSSLSVRTYNNYEKAVQKLHRYSNKQIISIEKEDVNSAGVIFEEALQAQRKIRLTLKTGKILECIPVDTMEKDGKLYFHVIFEEKEKNILAKRIACIEISREKFSKTKLDDTVIYRLTGNLAKNYNLRENEKIVNNSLPENETIITYGENIPMLLSRLLRYGELCEVINPEKVRLGMKEMINATLANYGD